MFDMYMTLDGTVRYVFVVVLLLLDIPIVPDDLNGRLVDFQGFWSSNSVYLGRGIFNSTENPSVISKLDPKLSIWSDNHYVGETSQFVVSILHCYLMRNISSKQVFLLLCKSLLTLNVCILGYSVGNHIRQTTKRKTCREINVLNYRIFESL